jgi:hypothetical protein
MQRISFGIEETKEKSTQYHKYQFILRLTYTVVCADIQAQPLSSVFSSVSKNAGPARRTLSAVVDDYCGQGLPSRNFRAIMGNNE